MDRAPQTPAAAAPGQPGELLAGPQGRLPVVQATQDRLRGLLQAVLTVGSGLDLETTLTRIVDAAVELVDAGYGALALAGDDERRLESGERPEADGSAGRNPPTGAFLGVPVRVGEQVFGNLFLTEKRGGGQFTKDDHGVLTALGAAAGIAIENARLYDEARHQQRWLQASGEVTTSLLSGTDPRHVLSAVTVKVHELSGADLVLLGIPEDDGRSVTITSAEGDGADRVRGLVLPADGSLAGQVLLTGHPVTVPDFPAHPRAAAAARGPMGHLGQMMIFPIGAPGNVRGVLSVGRRRGAAALTPATADLIASFAAQAGVALELAARRSDAERLSLYEDRDRIARDLHDLVIQRLYATGMSLEGMVPMIGHPEVARRVRGAVDAMDETIMDIRVTIFALQSRGAHPAVSLRSEIVGIVDEMAVMLGFAPSLRLGQGLDDPVGPEAAGYLLTALREALSNTARHARATRVEVSVEADAAGQLILRVTDNGTGIPAGVHRSGLRNLAQRAGSLNGVLELGPADGPGGRGTALVWRVPRDSA
ncbi:MAG TPA: GAF domain-containing protein [Streptosporangiaceae bacterium]